MTYQERRDGESLDQMLRKFKRKVKSSGVLQDLRSKEYFEPPSDVKKRKFKAAVRRNRQQQRADEL
jgi:small subunit ribosomal protein S21